MNRTAGLLIVVGGTLVASGCLQMESAHRLYLSPRGDVSWTVQESDVRSDTRQASARQEEEGRWLAGVESGSHPVAVAFRSLGARQLDTRLLRPIRPYSVVITGEFGPVDELANGVLAGLRAAGGATLDRRAGSTTLTIVIQPSDDEQDYDGPLTALFAELRDYRIVLTEGHFVAAEGFRLSEDGTVATPVHPVGDGVIRLSLTWSVID